ncbi:MAG: hypothetical protein JSS98_05675 [Bacteroidetes bacterium]|nr:hypothetical protein [Bacteroidota bacterium]
MKKSKTVLLLPTLFLYVSLFAQKSVVKKAPAVKNIKPAAKNNENLNTLSYTLVDSKGISKEISITSASGKTGFFNAVRIDRIHTDENGEKQPITKADIHNQKNENINATFYVPIIDKTATAVATYETDYNHTVGWHAAFDGYRLSPQNIIIAITKWAAVGDFMEGTFSGTATLIKENTIYDNENPAPTCTIQNGKFRIKRVNDQTSYGGE